MSTPYTVRPGDTLSHIAAKHGFPSYRDIYEHPDNAAFRIKRPNPNLIYPGDALFIPAKIVGAAAAAPASPPTAKYVKPPKLVKQQLGVSTGTVIINDCWAAALESWLEAFGFHTTAAKLCALFVKEINSDLTLPDKNFPTVANHINVRMSYERLATPLTAAYLIPRLDAGPVYLAFSAPGSSIGHVVVGYGVGRPSGGMEMVSIMEPRIPSYQNVPLTFFTGLGSLTVGWRSKPFSTLKGQGFW